jgi:hypothetical protein
LFHIRMDGTTGATEFKPTIIISFILSRKAVYVPNQAHTSVFRSSSWLLRLRLGHR